MGHKISALTGVKSENYTQPGNAINEIWVGNTEIISRLPFGDNDMEQAGWPEGGVPKIPWHNFIIPLKRDLEPSANNTPALNFSGIAQVPTDQLACCNRDGCITRTFNTLQLVTGDLSTLYNALLLTFLAYLIINIPLCLRLKRGMRRYKPNTTYYDSYDVWFSAFLALATLLTHLTGTGLTLMTTRAWLTAIDVHNLDVEGWNHLIWFVLATLLFWLALSSWATALWGFDWMIYWSPSRKRREENADTGDPEDNPPPSPPHEENAGTGGTQVKPSLSRSQRKRSRRKNRPSASPSGAP